MSSVNKISAFLRPAANRVSLAWTVLRHGAPLPDHGRQIYGLMQRLSRRDLAPGQIAAVQVEAVVDLLRADSGMFYSYNPENGHLARVAGIGEWKSLWPQEPTPLNKGDKAYFVDVAVNGAAPVGGRCENWFMTPEGEPFALWINDRAAHSPSQDNFNADLASGFYGHNPRFISDILFLLLNRNGASAEFIMLANWTKNAGVGRFYPIIPVLMKDQVEQTLMTFRDACSLARIEAGERQALERHYFELRMIGETYAHDAKNRAKSSKMAAVILRRAMDKFMSDPTEENRAAMGRMLAIIEEESGSGEKTLLEMMNKLLRGDIEYEMNFVPMNLSKWFAERRVMLEQNFSMRDISAHVEIIQEPLPVKLDERLFSSRVLGELLTNAAKYGGSQVEINVCKSPTGAEAVFSVSDHGIGLNSQALCCIFDRGERATDVESQASSGLGLFDARMVVEGHGGRIWAESPGIGQGTTFYVTLPLIAD